MSCSDHGQDNDSECIVTDILRKGAVALQRSKPSLSEGVAKLMRYLAANSAKNANDQPVEGPFMHVLISSRAENHEQPPCACSCDPALGGMNQIEFLPVPGNRHRRIEFTLQSIGQTLKCR